MKRKTKLIILLVVVLIGTILFWWRYCFVLGTGVKAGNLNYFEKKGVVFKTYEGRIIQEGFKAPTPGALQSNEFTFSVEDDSVALVLERSSGKFIEVRYKEYLNSLMWRGDSKYIITDVLSVKEHETVDKYIDN
ncbi:MAG: hypothetical protein ACHQNT_09510 [Bacteroidia bacterium]